MMKNLDWHNLDDRIKMIDKIAKDLGWMLICHQNDTTMLSYGKDGIRINIYYTKMTIGTCLEHPKKGKTQLFRRWVNEELLIKIFKNPRIHTNKGYQKN